jgi:class 3 adenylate cyclase
MGTVALYVKDVQACRFVCGTLSEAEALFGSPLPLLPPPEIERGQSVYLVRSHPLLRSSARKVLLSLLAQIGVDFGPAGPRRPDAADKEQAEYETILARALRGVRAADRRLGITNLFWLAHTREIVDLLREMESHTPQTRKIKYSLHPLLSSFYRRIDQTVRRDVAQAEPERHALLTGSRENPSLVEALLEDGLAFTEGSIADFDFNQFLASNKRYRLSTDVFFDIFSLLLRETERRIRENDRLLLNRIARHVSILPRNAWLSQPGLTKITLHSQILSFLLADPWATGTKLMALPKVKAEAERRRPAEILDAFLDLVNGIKRFEFISHLRDRVELLRTSDSEIDERVRRGLRVYEFGEAAQVLNNAVSATVLFLDLRGFTKTSEGQISERDLTQELYTVFDTFVPVVQRFGGSIDKFLGDGMMITFGTSHGDPLDPLNALRTALLCQEALRHLREEGRTYFKMGIAIHYGRVYLAHFIADEETIQSTVIGRNVNLAGRLSSAAKRPMEEDEDGQAAVGVGEVAPQRPSGLAVTVDSNGTLFNEGIAISRDTLVQIESHLPLTHVEDAAGRRMEYFDDTIGKKIVLRYSGDAKFKGVRSSFPVYEADYE